MIQVLMFDLGDTLVDQNKHPFPHVTGALTAIASFKTQAGAPLLSCLVSDFSVGDFAEYLAILDATTLRPFFEPVDKRVTLSTHADVTKPDRKIFETALRRLGSTAPLEDCLLITENGDHIAAARSNLRMKALQFGQDFTDWSQAPALIRLTIHGVEMVKAGAADTAGNVPVTGHVWHRVSIPGHSDLKDIQVPVPVKGHIDRGELSPSPESIEEATHFARSLAEQNQIAGRPGAFRASHAIETDAEGNRKLVRKRFSAL